MSKSKAQKAESILASISTKQRRAALKQFRVEDQDEKVRELLKGDTNQVFEFIQAGQEDATKALDSANNTIRLIQALMAIISDMGETTSEIKDKLTQQTQLAEDRRLLLEEQANEITKLGGIEYFFYDLEECKRFVSSLGEETKDNLMKALLET